MASFDFLKNTYAKVGFGCRLVLFYPTTGMGGFATAGLAVFTAYLDYVLMPALFISMGLFYFGYNQYQKNKTV